MRVSLSGFMAALFPRLHRRGLIEARWRLVLCHAQPYFRAFTGAVSLKRIQQAAEDLQALIFPRLHRRGLIEATGAG